MTEPAAEKVLIIAVPVLVVNNVPYGPAVVSGILKHHGYDSTVWDLNVDLYQKYRDHWTVVVDLLGNRAYRPSPEHKLSIRRIMSITKRMLKNKIQEIQPDIVLLSVFSSQSLDLVIPLSSMVKDLSPNSYTLVGGRGLDNTERLTKLRYGDYYAKYLPLDCWYLGDAENNLVNVIQQRYKGVFRSPPVSSEHIEAMPAASWNGYDFSLYNGYTSKSLRMPITGSKGCVRDCTFCDVADSWPKFVYRKGEDIARELIDTYRKTGINKFEFTDNLVNGSIKNFRAMNSYLAQHQPDTLNYMGYAICRPKNEFPSSDFVLARRAGAEHFRVGIESGSEQVRFNMKKKFSNEDISWFAENCHDNGISQQWLMFVGYPTETEQDFQDTLDLLKKHRHLTGDGLLTVFLNLPMMLTSGSAFMRKYQEQYGLTHNNSDPWSDFFWTSSIYQDNTFEIRANRWRRMIEAVRKYGYENPSLRQAEKFLEIEGIEQIYRENYSNGKKIIPIAANKIHVNKETHL